jgi:hypothetical protein
MSQEQDKYLYFNVGLLKNSFALEALRQDALKYHMIDQPGQLIAMRLTEYYELIARGIVHPGASSTSIAVSPTAITHEGSSREGAPVASPLPVSADEYDSDDDGIVATSPDVDLNADEAAEYWSRL